MMGELGHSKYSYLYLLILIVILSAGKCDATTDTWTQPMDGLRLGLSISTPIYKDPNIFQLSIVFQNLGKEKIIILPESTRRIYQVKGQGVAKYVPFPGPPIPPWRGAFPLLPGQKNEIKYVGMKDRDGIWVLEPGTYNISIKYVVPQDLAVGYGREFPNSKDQVWIGHIETEKLTITFQP
jgi:hypothetical protein